MYKNDEIYRKTETQLQLDSKRTNKIEESRCYVNLYIVDLNVMVYCLKLV